MSSTLQRALGTRARAFQLSIESSSPLVFTLGLILDSAEAGRLVDQGPSAENDAACEEFKTFWGEKSELRRFKDGAILESVVWDEIAPGGFGQQRNKVVKQIVEYILNSRFGIGSSRIDFFAGGLDAVIVEPEVLRKAIYLEDSVANNKGFGNIMGVYDELTKELTGLTDLPLAISSISPASPGLRYSTIFTPSPRRLKEFGRFPDSTKFIEIHDIILTMEGSGRWPEDLEGIQKIKAAFLAKIGEKLSSLSTIYRTEIVFDLNARPIDDNISLEILTATGFAFRARMNYERSLLLLEAREKKMGISTTNSTESSLEAYKTRFIHGPKHHAALATLQHHFTSYSPTIRLVKRWFSSHLLSNHFPEELIELLVASIFIDSTAIYEVPNSGATGFARTMEKLSNWAWKSEALLIPLYTFSTATTSGRRPTLSPEQKAVARAEFELRRLNDPNINSGGAWVLATEEDLGGKVWGRGLSKIVAGRVKVLARAALTTLEEGVKNGNLVAEVSFFDLRES